MRGDMYLADRIPTVDFVLFKVHQQLQSNYIKYFIFTYYRSTADRFKDSIEHVCNTLLVTP